MKNYKVVKGERSEIKELILNIHYAKRWPSISYIFCLMHSEKGLMGCVTYGTPPSATLRSGIAGVHNSKYILELNRLVLIENNKNEASFLIGSSLRMLPNSIVVSFADTEQNHIGYVYQACNFTYHGLSAKRTDWKIKGMEHLHGQTIADEFRGKENRSGLMREKYGDAFYLKDRSRKHRYIYVTGDKIFSKKIRQSIKYPEQSYPK